MCLLKLYLDLNSLPQTLQGRATPSRCCPSIWSLIAILCPSFPQTLQILALCVWFPLWMRFSLTSISDLTFSSSLCTSPGIKLRISTFWFSHVCRANDPSAKVSDFVGLLGFSFLWNGIELVCCKGACVFSSLSSVCPVSPLSLRSSAMARKESRLSWKTFASPR